MSFRNTFPSRRRLALLPASAVAAALVLAGPAQAGTGHQPGFHGLTPGNLLVSGSTYTGDPGIVAGQTVLPPGCTTGCVTATADGTYPQVFNNVLADPSFGVTSTITLTELSPSGRTLGALAVPSASSDGRAVTSFSSKSELALNLSTDGRYVTFMGYDAAPDSVDVSNSNTPGAVDPTNPVPGADYRVVARLGADGRFQFTNANAYSGNNGRAAILNDRTGEYYTAGNAGNGSSPQPAGIVLGAGAQLIRSSWRPQALQHPGLPTPVGSFSVTQLGDSADKVGKDDNFRGLTEYDNVLYYSKGSGSNGVNTVYFLDTTGKACPSGVGLPVPGAPLPTSPLAYNPATVDSAGLPSNLCVLQGFPTALKSSTSFPFGLWFAGPRTLYVADEGNGDNTYSTTTGTYTTAAGQATAGLQKWVLAGGSWHRAYTLSGGLDLGTPYTVPGYPTGDNAATGLPWAPATDGLRNITGRVNRDGTVTVYAVTSTVSGGGDQGADPNKLVTVTDRAAATAAAAGETFHTVRAAGSGQVLRGVSVTPGTRS
ncbi:MAG TPA: hypothetical protein VH089_15445 [Streptosporangiaceae bacterium]|nr:hypothetical protein [Streptosporangiaceae bacterium]